VLVTKEQVPEMAKNHRLCICAVQSCPNLLPVGDAIEAAKNGNLQPLVEVFNKCIGCGKCAQNCPRQVPILQMFQAAASWKNGTSELDEAP